MFYINYVLNTEDRICKIELVEEFQSQLASLPFRPGNRRASLRRQVSWQLRERDAEKGESAERRIQQNAVCVFRIKGRSIVDFPRRYLSDSSRHSWRHLRFSILRKRTRPLDTYYALRSSSSSSSSSLLSSVFSADVSPMGPVANAIRKSTRWYPNDYLRNRVQGGPRDAKGALVKSVDDTTVHFISN
ncbi:hypothetical protein ALC62_07693 [Cyphomyrmex costatus]|uniref:Uncharacterized protein n=1 Tax=Cyphomyrmex costatus TaxID=456900 RepID=A0A195CLB3_9HYME|nr:hypothetical protein ALC62_07693 [Cyphomyrmex costatus]